jgi:hypothetical protein
MSVLAPFNRVHGDTHGGAARHLPQFLGDKKPSPIPEWQKLITKEAQIDHQ